MSFMRLADWMGCSLDFHRASSPDPGWLLAQPPRRRPEAALHPPLMLLIHTRTFRDPLRSCSPLQGIEASFNEYFGTGTRAAYEGIELLNNAPQTPAPSTPAPASSGSGTGTTAAPAATPSTGGAAGTISARWCVPFEADNAFLLACSTAVSRGNANGVLFSCVAGGSNAACQDMVSRGDADLILLGGACLLRLLRLLGVLGAAACCCAAGLAVSRLGCCACWAALPCATAAHGMV